MIFKLPLHSGSLYDLDNFLSATKILQTGSGGLVVITLPVGGQPAFPAKIPAAAGATIAPKSRHRFGPHSVRLWRGGMMGPSSRQWGGFPPFAQPTTGLEHRSSLTSRRSCSAAATQQLTLGSWVPICSLPLSTAQHVQLILWRKANYFRTVTASVLMITGWPGSNRHKKPHHSLADNL